MYRETRDIDLYIPHGVIQWDHKSQSLPLSQIRLQDVDGSDSRRTERFRAAAVSWQCYYKTAMVTNPQLLQLRIKCMLVRMCVCWEGRWGKDEYKVTLFLSPTSTGRLTLRYRTHRSAVIVFISDKCFAAAFRTIVNRLSADWTCSS